MYTQCIFLEPLWCRVVAKMAASFRTQIKISEHCDSSFWNPWYNISKRGWGVQGFSEGLKSIGSDYNIDRSTFWLVQVWYISKGNDIYPLSPLYTNNMWLAIWKGTINKSSISNNSQRSVKSKFHPFSGFSVSETLHFNLYIVYVVLAL